MQLTKYDKYMFGLSSDNPFEEVMPSKHNPRVNAKTLHDPKTGKTYKSIAEAARAKGISENTLRSRLKTMSVDDALNKPVKVMSNSWRRTRG